MDYSATLKKYFGFDSFRPLQEEIINHLVSGKDALVLMPTGGGKSLCFQIPALVLKGTAVVISPLISLMKDQVDALCSNGISAAAMNSSLSRSEYADVRHRCADGSLKLLYLSPERLQADLEWIKNSMKVSLLVVDEAHCISTWGHDFRPEYTQLGALHELFPGVPIAAFTATADKVTREDILTQLRISRGKTFISSFDRPNLSLSVVTGCRDSEKISRIANLINRHSGESGIVYCMTRKTTEDVASELKRRGVSCECYHAGMSSEDRRRIQEDFKNDRVNVVCATVAFGMGIDKSDIRFIVHYNMPGSIEHYYQEIGRGGRDGLPCETVLFYNLQDIVTLKRFAEESGQPEVNLDKLRRMQDYAESTICRRRILLNYFGEVLDKDCKNCDVCQNPPERFDGTVIVQKLLSVLVRTRQNVSSTVAIDILLGEPTPTVDRFHYDQIKTFGAGADISREDWKSYLLQMIHLGFVEIDVLHYRKLKITSLGDDILYGRRKAEMSVLKHLDFRVKPKRKVRERSTDPENTGLFQALKVLRLKIAQKERLPAYIILGDKSLHDLAARCPTTIDAFGDCFGIGDAKKEKYGDRFVACIVDHLAVAPQKEHVQSIKTPKRIASDSYISQQKLVHENAYERWTFEDELLLKSLFQEGLSIKEIASQLGRNEGSIRSRLKKMGLR